MGGRAIACLNSRDRNVLGFRRDLLTAAAYGVDEFLLVYGDRPDVGRRSDDVSVRRMMEEIRTFGATDVFAGCRAVPGRGDDPPDAAWPRSRRDADFLVTQVSHTIDDLARWRDAVDVRRPDLRRRDGRRQRGDGPQARRREPAAGRAAVARRRRRRRPAWPASRRRARSPSRSATTAASPASTSSASAATATSPPGCEARRAGSSNRPERRPARAPDSVRRRAADRAAEGLAGEGDARAVRGGRPHRRAVVGRRLQGDDRRSRVSPRCASCAPRRSRCTSPRACSTSASRAATGSRRRAARSSASAS